MAVFRKANDQEFYEALRSVGATRKEAFTLTVKTRKPEFPLDEECGNHLSQRLMAANWDSIEADTGIDIWRIAQLFNLLNGQGT